MNIAEKAVTGTYLGALGGIGLISGTLPLMIGSAVIGYAGYRWTKQTLTNRSIQAHATPLAYMSAEAKQVRKNAKVLKAEYLKAKRLFKHPNDKQQLVLDELEREMQKLENDPDYADEIEAKIAALANSGAMQSTLERIGIASSLTAGALILQPWLGLLALGAYAVHREKVQEDYDVTHLMCTEN